MTITTISADQTAFELIKKNMCGKLIFQRENQDLPFVLRVDASGYAVGACLEQLRDGERAPKEEEKM